MRPRRASSWAACVLLGLLLPACSSHKAADKSAPQKREKSETPAQREIAAEQTARPGLVCEREAFARTVDLPEASGATFLNESEILLVGDSGNKGAFVVLDAKSGEPLRRGTLELDAKGSDDLEGVAMQEGQIVAITSSGWVREWSQVGDTFSPLQSSYALAPYDPQKTNCKSARSINCGHNFEGLCLLNKAPVQGQCAGFAASKSTGALICLTRRADGKLALDATRSIVVSEPEELSGCDFDRAGRLWYGNNFIGASKVGFVDGWQSPETAQLGPATSAGFGFPEAIALGPRGRIFRASDTSGSPSLLSMYICR